MIVRQAPAKVNLWLKICGKRSDGYHELDTLFAPLDLADGISLEKKAHGISLQIDGGEEGIPRGPDNLVWRAAQRFFKNANIDAGVSIRLEKRIPSGAGLGGGSSDAAAVLRGLEELYGYPAGLVGLEEIAVELGADVPFFLLSRAARGRGRGEILEPVAAPWSGDVLLCKPPFGVPTPWAYRAYAEMREAGKIPPVTTDPELWQNDLELPVFTKFPVLAVLKEWLSAQEGVVAAMMCGSGATMLAALQSAEFATPIRAGIEREFGPTFWNFATRIS
jgi:4-diphosphocytidyl-2-C-methyl-D-erythritol kinase